MISAQALVNVLSRLLSFMVLVNVQGSKGCFEEERLGLLQFKDSLNSSFFKGEDVPAWSINGDSNCCSWERVRCNHITGRVTHLFLDGLLLPDESIDATLNFSFLRPFEQLQYLDMSDNYFAASVEIEGLCGLKNLQELDISHNIIDVSLPECMANLTSLRVLDLSSTSLIGNMPSFISSLNSLEYLSLFDNKIDGLFPFSLLANHSKLEVFRLSSIVGNLHVETETQSWLPSFQLKVLQLGNCNLNSQQGSVIPSFLLYQHELRLIDLSHNNLQGNFPTWILTNNSKLEILRLTNNSFIGTLQLPAYINGLVNLAISSNKFGGQLPENIGKIFPNLTYLNVAKDNFEGSLPSSMVEMQKLQILDLSNNNFSGELSRNFFSNWTSLIFLSLSNNNFSGQVIPNFSDSTRLKFLFLDNNNFCGEIDDGILNKSSLLALDLSSNMLNGSIPRWIGNFSSIELLSMSKNLLEAEIPFETCNLRSITYLDLSENGLHGPLPNCFDKLRGLKFLHVQKNDLVGPIPTGIPESLYSLDLRDNSLSGRIPNIYGKLRVLQLRENLFVDNDLGNLCYLKYLRILDLSSNLFRGPIPSCLANITFEIDQFESCQALTVRGPCIGKPEAVELIWYILENTVPSYNSTLILNYTSLDDYYVIKQPLPAEFGTKNDFYSYTGFILELMSGLDLSLNNFSGVIPLAIAHKGSIISTLNLSYNVLAGTIPESFSNLINLESLDLSYNSLSGAIPPGLTALNSLEIFNVSYNNLSGPVPTEGQFANFDIDNYRGNPGLSGPFLNRSSSRTMSTPPSPSEVLPSNEGGENHKAIELVSFYWGFVSSYVTVVLGLAIILWFSPQWSRVWFRFVDLCIYYCFPCFFRNRFC